MTVDDLKKLLDVNGIDEAEYDFPPGAKGLLDDVCYIQKRETGKWRIFYFERGEHFDESYHDTEAEACEQFLKVFYPELLPQIEKKHTTKAQTFGQIIN